MKKLLTYFIIFLSLTGCANTENKKTSQEPASLLQKTRVITTLHQPTDFGAMTASKTTLGTLGAAAMVSAGNDIVRQNNIKDPAKDISDILIKKLQKKRNVQLVSNHGIETPTDDPKKLLSVYTGFNYLLDIKTFNWMFGYYPTDWTHFQVIYSARMRLIDNTGKVVAEKMCQNSHGDNKNPPTQEDLLVNKAALLKQYIQQGAQQCTDIFEKELMLL